MLVNAAPAPLPITKLHLTQVRTATGQMATPDAWKEENDRPTGQVEKVKILPCSWWRGERTKIPRKTQHSLRYNSREGGGTGGEGEDYIRDTQPIGAQIRDYLRKLEGANRWGGGGNITRLNSGKNLYHIVWLKYKQSQQPYIRSTIIIMWVKKFKIKTSWGGGGYR